MVDTSYSSNGVKRAKKPKPLFSLFRKNKPDPVVLVPSPQLGSGINSQSQQQRRPRSKSLGRDPSINNRLINERENALQKLCQRENTSPTSSSSLADSLPLLPVNYKTPPVPPIPSKHQQSPLMSPISINRDQSGLRKFSSAHDLKKAAKLHQESINHATDKPLPGKSVDLLRSRSLSSTSNSLNTSRLQQPSLDDYNSDDDIPLGYLQSPISKPSSLLNDEEEDDDKDLIPIAALAKPDTSSNHGIDEYQTAADKYKERVKERLQFEKSDKQSDEDDDDIPISISLMSPKDRMKWQHSFK
ncbi:hypothetical protein BDB01DRAFT_720706 [Pilobolus umbonatus]|nr:hypothetical protein BDB01DRAFT_720706 [Pilobolus umbonatus]